MPNHVHTILSATDGNLSDVLRDLKRYTSRKISELPVTTNNQRLLKFFSTSAKRVGKGNTLKVWQSGSHPEAVTRREFFFQKLNYIHNNPVRKGYVLLPKHWVYSSGRNYLLTDHSILKVDLVE